MRSRLQEVKVERRSPGLLTPATPISNPASGTTCPLRTRTTCPTPAVWRRRKITPYSSTRCSTASATCRRSTNKAKNCPRFRGGCSFSGSVREVCQEVHPVVVTVQEALAAFLADEGDGAADDGLLHVFFAGFITGATTDTCQT